MRPADERDITDEPANHQTAVPAEDAYAGPSISVETLTWFALLLAAGGLRIADLDGTAFSVDEAARSYDAFQVANGEVPDTWRGDLVASATSYLFRIFDDTEFVAKIIPALAGLGLVAALIFTRPVVGRTAALITAALVSFSPLFVLHARSASEFAIGPLVCVIIIVSLLEYLRNPRTAVAFVLFVSLALAPLSDAIAVNLLIVTPIFVVLEAVLFKNREVGQAFRAFLSSPVQWACAVLVTVAAIQLGVTHFGTSVDADLPGLRLWADMLASESDSSPPGYFAVTSLVYDWPILVLGASAFIYVVGRLVTRRSLEPIDRLLLLWTIAGAVTLPFIADRDSGQLLLLLLPFAVLGGRALSELVRALLKVDAFRKCWPLAAVLSLLASLGALLLTQWSSGNASTAEQAILAFIPFVCVALVSVTMVRSRAIGAAAAISALCVVATGFMTHSSLAVSFADGTELAGDQRLTPRADELKATLDRLSAERDSDVVVDTDFVDELGWTLRDSRASFGVPAAESSILVTGLDLGPSGFAGLPNLWRVSEGWYPDDPLAPRRMWRWFLYREPFGETDFVEVRIYVRTV